MSVSGVSVKLCREQEIADEFSHTVMHGVKMHKALVHPGSPSARPLPPAPVPGSLVSTV